MSFNSRLCAMILSAFIAVLLSCSGDNERASETGSDEHRSQESSESREGRGEHSRREGRGEHSRREGRGEHGGREGRGEHSRESGESEEGEESGDEYAKSATYDKTRNGAHLVLTYDSANNAFNGTVTNSTTKKLERVRVEVHLSNGIELGPTSPKDLAAGETMKVHLPGSKSSFERWSAHPEVGNEEHSSEGNSEHR